MSASPHPVPSGSPPVKDPPPPTPTDFPVRETALRPRLGLARDELRALRTRHLIAGQDWILSANAVHWSEAAVEKIRRLISPQDAPPPSSAAQDAAAPQKTPPHPTGAALQPLERPIEVLYVLRAPANRRIVEAYRPGTDPHAAAARLRVIVRDNRHFTARQRDGSPFPIPVRHVQADLYELVGTCPRVRGGPVGGPAAADLRQAFAGGPNPPGKGGASTPARPPATSITPPQ